MVERGFRRIYAMASCRNGKPLLNMLDPFDGNKHWTFIHVAMNVSGLLNIMWFGGVLFFYTK